jgi:hypothetical protein
MTILRCVHSENLRLGANPNRINPGSPQGIALAADAVRYLIEGRPFGRVLMRVGD